ncbi:hypothetical protein SNEBB_004883 [Seison nebaliae]|nr:hypothetical protein SNEBB_004883 [Seison nebaliae]
MELFILFFIIPFLHSIIIIDKLNDPHHLHHNDSFDIKVQLTEETVRRLKWSSYDLKLLIIVTGKSFHDNSIKLFHYHYIELSATDLVEEKTIKYNFQLTNSIKFKIDSLTKREYCEKNNLNFKEVLMVVTIIPEFRWNESNRKEFDKFILKRIPNFQLIQQFFHKYTLINSHRRELTKIRIENIHLFTEDRKDCFQIIPWFSYQLPSLSRFCQCHIERFMGRNKNIHKLVSFPLILNGKSYGKIIRLQSILSNVDENERRKLISSPRITISLILYIRQIHNPNINNIYSIIYTSFSNDTYDGFVFSLTNEKFLAMYIYKNGILQNSARGIFKIPIRRWCLISLHFTINYWNIEVSCKDKNDNLIKYIGVARFNFKNYLFHLDDTKININIGGNQLLKSVTGVLLESKIYRNQIIPHRNLVIYLRLADIKSYLNEFHSEHKCFLKRMKTEIALDNFKEKQRNLSISSYAPKHFFHTTNEKNICLITDRSIEDIVGTLKNETFEFFKTFKYNKNLRNGQLESGYDESIRLLETSACFDDAKSSNILIVLFYYEIGRGKNVEEFRRKSLSYIIEGIYRNDKLSLQIMAMWLINGNNLLGIPIDHEQAFVYLEQIMELHLIDMIKPKSDESSLDSFRFTNSQKLESYNKLDQHSDTFQFVLNQARNGVKNAKLHAANLLFQGTNGIRRNLQMAMNFYRDAIDDNQPQMMTDFGIRVLNGVGQKGNSTEAKEVLKKSIELGDHRAYSPMGYIALNIERDISKAIFYWEKGFNKTKDPSCAYNLAQMWLAGKYPNKTQNISLAWEYISHSAMKGFIYAQRQVSVWNMKGHYVQRNVYLSIQWALSIAKASNIYGILTEEAFRKYFKNDLYYSAIIFAQSSLIYSYDGKFNLAHLCYEHPKIEKFFGSKCSMTLFRMLDSEVSVFQNDIFVYESLIDFYYKNRGTSSESIKLLFLISNKLLQRNHPKPYYVLGRTFETTQVNISHNLKLVDRLNRMNGTSREIAIQLFSKCQETETFLMKIICTFHEYTLILEEFHIHITEIVLGIILIFLICLR